MKKPALLLVLAVSLALILSACGGGGGGGTTTSPTIGTQSVTVSGFVGIGLSSLVGSGVGSGSIRKQQIESASVTDAMVEVFAYDKKGNETGSFRTTTLSGGAFTGQLALSNGGGKLIINVSKRGYTSFSKTVEFDKPSNVNIRASIDEAVSKIIPLTGDIQISKATVLEPNGKKYVKIALFNDRYGKQSIVTGADIKIRKQQTGSSPTLEIGIPFSSISSLHVSALKADLKSYNPVTDSKMFPGEFKDDKGNKIVSLGFDYINLTDDSGRNLGQVTQTAIQKGKISKAQVSADPTYISRWIYKENCSSLLEDYCKGTASDDSLCSKLSDTEKAGFNVPVYSYQSSKGTWVMLGVGTLDLNGDGAIDSNNDLISNGTKTDYQNSCNINNGVYMKVLITNEDFLTQWWNLDYPLIFETPKELCLDVTLKNDTGQNLSGSWLYFDDDDYDPWSFNTAWGTTDSNGNAKLKVYLNNSSDSDRKGTLYAYNPYSFVYESYSSSVGVSPNCTKKTITFTKPPVCEVEGYVKEGNQPVANQYVYIYSLGSYYYNYAYTDNQGYFKMDAKCGEDQQVYVGYDYNAKATFNPNGTIGDYESKDEGTPIKVTLKNLIKENQAPNGYGYLSSYSVSLSQDKNGKYIPINLLAYIWGWDSECDTPISYELKSGSTTLDSGSFGSGVCYGYKDISFPMNSTGSYPITLKVTDSKGKTSTYDLGTVVVSPKGENRKPEVYAYASAYSVAPGSTVTLYGYAYDYDGDTLNYSWNYEGGDTGTGNYGYVYSTSTYTVPTDFKGEKELCFNVNDGTGEASSCVKIFVGTSANLNIGVQGRRK